MSAIKRYFQRNLQQLFTNGLVFDETLNVIFGGAPGVTVSMHVAQAAGWGPNGKEREGTRFACLFCKYLDIFVQKDHCRLQFVSGPTNTWTWIRAGIAFAGGILAVRAIVLLVWHAIRSM
jgi:hypothetical protein